ncbi:sugar transporter ERD6-like 5 [Iris pallida]|uniref:Sugar transporter ERD6-like 5 n=1 Tax=Iris pallida TaxID=29817 RepID=A0AAX6FYS9_IRIPA|nr:sugar transporter ERD6-like 5 [Iris pallida]
MEGVGDEEMVKPLLVPEETSSSSIWMVVISTAVAVCGSFEFGIAVGFSSPTQAQIIDDLGVSLPEYSLFGSILNIGAMIGAIMSGRVADTIGRKRAMAVADLVCIVGWLPIIFSKDIWWLDLGRLLVGYGIGLLSYVVPVYIAEITPKDLRGGLATVNQLLICGGANFAFLSGTVLAWRSLAFTGILPCLLQLLGLFFIPESPRWLANTGRENEFESALQRIRGKGTDISQEVEEIKEFTKTLNSLPRGSMLALFQKRYVHAVIVGVGLMAFQQFGGINGVGFYASSVFVSAGFSSGKLGTIAIALLSFPMTGLGALLMDRSGRRPLLLVSAAGTCLGLIFVTISFLLQFSSHASLKTSLALAGILVYMGSFSLGMGAIPWIIMSEANISYKHEGRCRKSCHLDELVWCLVNIIHIQFSHVLESIRHVLCIHVHLRPLCCVCGVDGTGDEGENSRRYTGFLEFLLRETLMHS